MRALGLLLLFLTISCASGKKAVVSDSNVKPGSSVKIFGKKAKLHKGSLKVGQSFLKKTKRTDLAFKFNNKVTIINVVPSIDTPVCEEQTHILGETRLPKEIELVSISRDLPMAQKRFAKESKLTMINYYSDYKTGSFGKRSGLMIKGEELLARGVIVLDKKGVIRYMQFVDEITALPNMQKAFKKAQDLL